MEYKKVLELLEENGYKAYVVGGYVRDKILKTSSFDADIITNATPKEISNIFKNEVVEVFDKYGAVKLKGEKHLLDVTTFRKELLYKDGKPVKIEYVNSLTEDLVRRDFTINALCMDKFDNIIDPINVKRDLELKIIRTIRDTKVVLKEDPSRMLRALRFMSELNFKLSEEIEEYILNNKSALSKISYTKRKEELDKLFSSGHSLLFFKYIKDNKLFDYIGIRYVKIVETGSIIGIWSQLEVDSGYNFTKNERKMIQSVKYLIKKGRIEATDVYKYGLTLCKNAAIILGISLNDINTLYTNLEIKGIIDIDIKSEEIKMVLNLKDEKNLSKIYKYIEDLIVRGKLHNNKSEIINALKKWGEVNA